MQLKMSALFYMHLLDRLLKYIHLLPTDLLSFLYLAPILSAMFIKNVSLEMSDYGLHRGSNKCILILVHPFKNLGFFNSFYRVQALRTSKTLICM